MTFRALKPFACHSLQKKLTAHYCEKYTDPVGSEKTAVDTQNGNGSQIGNLYKGEQYQVLIELLSMGHFLYSHGVLPKAMPGPYFIMSR
jgi:hypothetical protein